MNKLTLKKIITSVLVITFLFTNTRRAPAEEESVPVNLTTYVRDVLSRSPNLKRFDSLRREVQSGLSEVNYRRLPQLSIQSAVTRGDNSVYVFSSLLEQKKFGPENFAINELNNPDYRTNFKNALVLGLPLFSGFEIQSNRKLGQFSIDQVGIQIEASTQYARYEALEAYLAVLLRRSVLEVMKERMTSAESEVESARKLNARGLVLGSDYYAAQAVLGFLKAERVQAEKNLQGALQRFIILAGREETKDALDEMFTNTAYTIISEEEFLAAALKNRGDYRQTEIEKSKAETSVDLAGFAFLPRVEAFASIETNTDDFESNPTHRMIGLKSHFPVGDPAYFAKKSKARAHLEAISQENQSLEEKIRLEVSQAFQQWEVAVASKKILEEVVANAEKSLTLFRPLYREGRQSIIDVLRAEESLARSQKALLENNFGIHLAYAGLHLTAGLLDAGIIQNIQINLEKKP